MKLFGLEKRSLCICYSLQQELFVPYDGTACGLRERKDIDHLYERKTILEARDDNRSQFNPKWVSLIW